MKNSYCPAANQTTYPFILPELPFDKSAFLPDISIETFEYHHGKHHNAYVGNLNKLLENSELKNSSLEHIMEVTFKDPEKVGIYNNAAQIWNHSFFWNCMQPKSTLEPKDELLEEIIKSFGSFQKFSEDFKAACLTQFGSGWGWLVYEQGKLKIMKTSNADCPLSEKCYPLLTCDVWEHAYYIDNRNNRAKFIDNFLLNQINWTFISENLKKARNL